MRRTRPFTEPSKSNANSINSLFRVFADENAPIEERKKAREALRKKAGQALALFCHPQLRQVGPLLKRLGK
jgi:hypothetical protein